MSPKKLLYVGNKISAHGYNKTTIETLGVLLSDEGFQVFYTSNKKHPLLRLLDMVFTTVVKIKKVDCILIDTYSTSSFWYAFFCSQIARVFKVPYIPLLHGGNLPDRLKNNPTLCRMIFKHAYVNVAPSSYLKHHFNAFGFENVLFIPNSIELAAYEFKERTVLQPKILWVRAFDAIYNPEMAVDVHKALLEKYPEATLTMVGPDKDGSLIRTQEKASQLQLNVTFTGQLPKAEWLRMAQAFDVFINTTHFDNTPISVLEAMALGLPVVSTDVGGIPFLLSNDKNALLVADGDVSQMVAKIDYLLQHPAVSQKIITCARALVLTIDWNVVKSQWIDLLTNSLKNK